ncbi:site-specific DNA-methyltransferase [Lactiplantibacillus plantarum subsp. plantarum]|nr:site-specific DNA-methyltransferase [Lactiplantibacillus plantarum subsp. plantarum]AWY48573.1 hypothetical protein CFN49_10130 [Lactiplantibacillus plantarum]MZV26147.1 site-specific DNA-methyltransferase [Lactiplantibacillus plantarum]
MTNNKSKIILDDGIMRQQFQDELVTALNQWGEKWLDKNGAEELIDNYLTNINTFVKQALDSGQGNYHRLTVPESGQTLKNRLQIWQASLTKQLNQQYPSNLVESLSQEDQQQSLITFQSITELAVRRVKPILMNIIQYFNATVTEQDFQTVNGQVTEEVQPWLVYNSGYEDFHQRLLNEINTEQKYKVNAVVTDPPYFIGMADWDTELPETGNGKSKESEFKTYLLSINKLLADDGLIAIFNVKENIDLLKSLVNKLSQDRQYPDFDFRIMNYMEWVKTNPNHKTDKQYNQRSEYIFVAYRNTESGRRKYAKRQLNNSLFESAALSKPFNNRGYINQTPKPPRMVMRLLQRLTSRDDTILDSYAGSGSIALAGYSLGRKVYSCELSRYTQIKATNQFEDYKNTIGQQVLRDESWRDLKEFDINDDEQELIDATFWSYLRNLATVEQRRSLVNAELINIKDAYRERYANKQIKQGAKRKTAKNHAEYAQYQIDQLEPEELGILLGFGQIWHDGDFLKLFGFDNSDLGQAEKVFDPVALNLAIRFRNQYHVRRHTNDYPSMLMDFSQALGNAKRANTADQVISYEHYLLQLMNDLTNFEDEIRNRQNHLSHGDLKPMVQKRLSVEIKEFYRLVGILVLTVNAIEQSGWVDDGAMSEFNVIGDLNCLIFERNRQRGDYSKQTHALAAVKDFKKLFEDYPELWTSDAGNTLKDSGLSGGFDYYQAFLKRHYEGIQPTVIEVPALRPLTVIRTLNIHWSDVQKYSLYALQAGFEATGRHESLATSADNELVRKIYRHDRTGEKKYLKQLIQKKLTSTTVADLAKQLMMTQATVNNLRK